MTITSHPTTGPGRRRAPSPLGAIALLDLVKEHAAQVPAWESPDGSPLGSRHCELVELADDVELWVIHWPSGGHLQLHDHGGSSGAFWVVSGTLEERCLLPDGARGALGQRRHPAGSGTGFGATYLHDIRNGDAAPATSVHAYSPPMPAMTYYRTTRRGPVAERTERRGGPAWAP